MTARTTTFMKALFETGDVPTSADYGDWFDSFVNVVDSTAQSLNSDLTFVGNATLTINNVSASIITATQLRTEVLSAQTIYTSALRRTVNTSIAALGAVIGSAYQMTNDINVINAVTSAVNDGVNLLRTNNPGRQQLVFNRSASLLKVYPATTVAQIDTLGVGNPFKVTAGEEYAFTQISSTLFLSGK